MYIMSCSDCGHYRRDGFLSGYCYILGETVSATGSCKHYHSTKNTNTRENSGYNGGCFLTTACVDYFGMTDDCYALTTLRKFRDEHLLTDSQGKELVNEYYSISPAIVQKIDASNDKEGYYRYIYNEIQKCISQIESCSNDDAVETYRSMVYYLMKEFDSKDL